VISDTLETAIDEIDRCLSENPDVYESIRLHVTTMRTEMNNLRNVIDCGPVSGFEDMARTAGKV
jgi:hypothetical protein